MKYIETAFKFTQSAGESIHVVFAKENKVEEGSEKQISYAKDLISSVLADTQAKLNLLFKSLSIKNEADLKEAYEDFENNTLKSINMMLGVMLNAKKASTIINAFSTSKNIKNILQVFPKLEEKFEEEGIDF